MEYPYSVYSLVEVPAALRTFGGDSKLSSVLGMPGILMMPETSLPTMHFDSLYDPDDYYSNTEENWTDPNWVGRTRYALMQYFGLDQYAGNHLVHLHQSVFSDQVNATGSGANMLNQVLMQLVQMSLADREISFDVDIALDREVLNLTQLDSSRIGNVLRKAGNQSIRRAMGLSRFDQILDFNSARDRKLTSDTVFDAVESLSLLDFDPSDISTLNRRAMRLRTLATTRVLNDLWGTEVINSIIAELLQQFRGQNFTYEDFIFVAQSQGAEFESHLDDTIQAFGLPGFILANATQRRISVEDEESPTFETTFTLQNGEPAPGYCAIIPDTRIVSYNVDDFLPKATLFLGPNQTLEVVIQSNAPIYTIWIKPYLSLNRNAIRINVPPPNDLTDEESQFRVSFEVVSSHEIDSNPSTHDPFIVIDDLDSGFSVVDASNQFRLQPLSRLTRYFLGISDREMIRGLPAFQFYDMAVAPDTWERKVEPAAYGKYLKTFALNRGGNSEAFAKFVATLPEKGSWRLEYFLPNGVLSRVRHYAGSTSGQSVHTARGTAQFNVYVGDEVLVESIDTEELDPGWHVIGEYTVNNTEVEVWISNPNTYGTIFADAIRWSPIESVK